MGVYSSIKTTVKVVVTAEQRGDSSDQELLVSSTLLSTEDRARVSLYYAPVHVTTCSVPVPRQRCSCYWQSHLYLWRWRFSSPDDDDLFHLRRGRFYLQWRHLCPGWKGNTLWELHFHLTDSGRFHHNACCVHLKLALMAFFISGWDIPLHGLHINSRLKYNLATFPHFPPHITFLSLCLLGLKHSAPSALNDERQNLLLCTSATVILF